MKKEKYLEKAVLWAKGKNPVSLKSITEGYESPKICTSTTTQEEIQADVSFVTFGGVKHYSVVALKGESPKKLVARWKVLSFLASMSRGKLYLLAPNGHKAFTQKLVNAHDINAVIHSL